MPVKSRLLVGVGAWLLGVAAATTGSMIVVNQIAHGLLGPQTQQLSQATLSVNPDDRADRPSPSAAANSGRPSPSAAARPDRDPVRTRSAVNVAPSGPSASATAPPHQTAAGTLLQSPYGSVTAECQPGGAYLLYWSPEQGYQADDVFRGPAATASVSFEGPANEVVMQVSCKSGSPIARVSADN